MPRLNVGAAILTPVTLVALLLAGPRAAWADTPRGVRQTMPNGAVIVRGSGAGDERTIVVDDQDAIRTREKLIETLHRYPPSLGRVLKLDPSLLSNQAYLAPYPALAALLSQHPEVAHNSTYFLSSIYTGESSPPMPDTDHAQTVRMVQETLRGIIVVSGIATVLAILAWVVKMIIDYRRWNRLARVQSDAHTKLLDRLTSNEEILAYVQSSAGKSFLRSAPIALDSTMRGIGAPIGRILWSVQAGIVVAAVGIGLQFVSWRFPFDSDTAQPLSAMGTLAVALGVGFVMSAGVSYVLSRRLGLFDPAAPAEVEPAAGPRV